ncbi:aldolase [Phytoactinopolyspora mesophila]|uniref:Aldolase n=1 Tax=Phytoactinopolyspora mesophila TaxID=2650750 RepID=A0A7K3LYS7_9ACTN|nr:aldolase [Phytoactinopolyspora mesophila]NDL56150.1 aldolase [Phytoactinopolyspora mesophila]
MLHHEKESNPLATNAAGAPDLAPLTRPSGAFAMLALDQREALRAMLAEHRSDPVTDQQVTEFKLTAARVLTPFASAVLLDKQFVLDQAISEKAIAPGCSLIAAADEFVAGSDEFVADTRIDHTVDPVHYRDHGAVALKLLVVWRPDEDPARRIELVERFVARSHAAGLASIIEPVSRAPRGGGSWDWDAGVLAAVKELGDLGADLYKAEVPLHGLGDAAEIRRRCAQITETLASPWVVLSSGVPEDAFPRAVELAVAEGASGFLAGRAVWQSSIGASDVEATLRSNAVSRLRRLCDVVDEGITNR